MLDLESLKHVLYAGTCLGTSELGSVAVGMPDGDITVIHLDSPSSMPLLTGMLRQVIHFEGYHERVDLRARAAEDLKLVFKGILKDTDIPRIQDIIRLSEFDVDPTLTINVGFSKDIRVWVKTDTKGEEIL